MLYVNEIMSRTPPTIRSDASVQQLAELLMLTGAEGVCVVDDGELVGVATAMDLFHREKRMPRPGANALARLVIQLSHPNLRSELAKATGVTVSELMSSDPETVSYDDPLEHLATLMVEGHYTVMPVMRGERLIGVVTSRDVVRAIVEQFRAYDLGDQPPSTASL